MRVKHIKFNVNKPGETLRFEGQAPLRKPDTLQELNWSLGMGPCGRWVESLEVDITLAVVTIVQTSYEGDYRSLYSGWVESHTLSLTLEEVARRREQLKAYQEARRTKEIKTFIYKLEDVRGRIEAIE